MGACFGGAASKDDQLWLYVRPDEKRGELNEAQVEVLQTLLATKQVNVNCRREGGDTPMHWVVREQAPPSVRLIDWLAQYKPDLELQNDAQKTPLHCAAGGRVVAHVQRLIQLNANVNAPGAFRSTPIMYACALGLHANAEALLAAPALNITVANENGDTAINRLARLGARERNSPDDLRLAELMVARGADINKPNAEGFTPLLSACASGKANLIAYFIGLGASLDARNAYGEGVKELATREHVKFAVRAYEALRDEAALERATAALVLSYAIQHPSEAK